MSLQKSDNKKFNIKQTISKCWIYFAILVIVMAIVFSVFRALTPWARQYKGKVEHYLTTLLDQHVDIGSMETGWYWFSPVLRLNNVSLIDNQSQSIQVKKLLVGINLLGSIIHWQVRPGVLYIEKTQLNLHQTDSDWSIDGLIINGQKVDLGDKAYVPLLAWLSTWDKLVIRHASLIAHFKDHSVVTMKDINLSIQNKGGHYYLRGRAVLNNNNRSLSKGALTSDVHMSVHEGSSTTSKKQVPNVVKPQKKLKQQPTHVSLKADVQLNTSDIQHAKGHVSFSLVSFNPANWQKFFPSLPFIVTNGNGGVKIWIDFKNGLLTQAQSVFHFNKLKIHQMTQKDSQLIESVGGHFGWRMTKEGWELNGNGIKLNMNGSEWPENKFFVQYNAEQQSYHIFIQHIILSALREFKLSWPEVVNPIIKMNPSGNLYDTELVINKNQLNYLLIGFSNLSWILNGDIPGVSNLSGVLFWQPQQGRLQLDSHDVEIKSLQLPPAILSRINLTTTWDTADEKTRLKLDNIVIQSAGLDFTASGMIDNLKKSPKIQLDGKFNAEDAQKWFQYIPPKSLKPKLVEWLQHDIKRIGQVNGSLHLYGLWHDFPFDSTPGTFNVLANIADMDFYFNPKWPLTKHVDAYLTVDKRNLAAEIHHGDLNGVDINKLNLRIDNIGFDYETLLIHGELNANANQVLTYVVNSPLKESLSKLKAFDIEGMLGLDLKLEIPLYSQNDDILTRGIVLLSNNKIVLHHSKLDMSLGQVSGLINFDEKGLTKSSLTTVGPDTSLKVSIDSIHHPNPATQISFTGNSTVEGLQNMLHLPLSHYMQGPMNLKGVVQLNSGVNATDRIKFYSDLKEVQVELPGPLGKLPSTVAPLNVSLDLNGDKIQKVILDYKEAPSAIKLQAYPLDSDEWEFDVTQKYLTAKLRYQASTGTLSGNVARIQLPELLNEHNPFVNHQNKLVPQNIPNLDLTIDSLIYNNMDFGRLTLESVSTKSTWELVSCKLTTPTYVLSMKGNWTIKDKQSSSAVEGDFQTTNLAKTLQRWKIQPLVEASKGQILFSIDWSGSIFDFSLAKLDGDLNVYIKDGRITDLSRATEEKLGLGKLLSILSLQTIPRRLMLDFSDLYKSGYNFDQFKGNFKIHHGVMTTENSSVDGPVAYIGIKGDVDLAKQRLDLSMHIAPHVMASLPVVATIAGGPIAGIATWVASKIINEGFYRVTGYTYKVTGPWKDPVVQQKSILKHFYPPSQLPRQQQ